MQEFSKAKHFNVEGLQIAEEFGVRLQLFRFNVLMAKIDFALGSQEHGIAMLLKMLEMEKEEEYIAILNYELSKIEIGELKQRYQKKALALYQKLYKKTPKFEYKERIEYLMIGEK